MLKGRETLARGRGGARREVRENREAIALYGYLLLMQFREG